MLYVDQLVRYPGCPWSGRSCHLVSDHSRLELVAFARALDCRESWLQDKPGQIVHFDLSASKRDRAICMGAQPVTRREFVEIMHRMRQKGLVGKRLTPKEEGSGT